MHLIQIQILLTSRLINNDLLSFHLCPWVWLLVCMCTTCMQLSTKARRGHTLPGTASGSCELPDNKPWSFAEHSACSAEPSFQPLSNNLHTLLSRDGGCLFPHTDLDLTLAVSHPGLTGILAEEKWWNPPLLSSKYQCFWPPVLHLFYPG